MADLELTRSGLVATLTLNRPDRLNAFSDEMLRRLLGALEELAVDTEVGAIILTGAGRAFCAGGDMRLMATRADRTQEQRLEDLRWKQRVPLALKQHPKPIIAMINGPAFGAGLGMVLACDFRLAADTAKFGTAFVKIGFSGDFGGTYNLTSLVGTAKARELYLLGDTLTAEEAMRVGLVSTVHPAADLAGATLALAQRLAHGPRIAYGYIKRNLLAAETETLATVLELEAVHQIRTAFTEDHREAAMAFTEKRKPNFQGR
jgi:2-(1,2-epoxy-1,2-dihydrophenyl)acetyl-CoA isomerase